MIRSSNYVICVMRLAEARGSRDRQNDAAILDYGPTATHSLLPVTRVYAHTQHTPGDQYNMCVCVCTRFLMLSP